MHINNDPILFTPENIKKIEELRQAIYVCDTEYKGHSVAVFYGDVAHPVSQSRYFALYYNSIDGGLMITDGSFIENQEIVGVVAMDGEIIFSRHRHDYRTSSDGSVFVDGGRDYTRTNTSKKVLVKVIDGVLNIITTEEELIENIISKEKII